jgi:hypothetical protein
MKTTKLILALLGAAAVAASARATLVTLNTSSLAGGTYYVDFQLNDGHGTGDGNNTATITGFNFGGGAVTGDIGAFGGVTGDLASTVTLTDTTPFNEFFESFTAGGFLSFDVQLTGNPDSPAPDEFGFALLDSNLYNLPTTALGSDQFVTADITGATPVFKTYAGVGGIPAPRVPETGSTALLATMALAGIAGLRRHLGRVALAA